jgi:hypothetical protein
MDARLALHRKLPITIAVQIVQQAKFSLESTALLVQLGKSQLTISVFLLQPDVLLEPYP